MGNAHFSFFFSPLNLKKLALSRLLEYAVDDFDLYGFAPTFRRLEPVIISPAAAHFSFFEICEMRSYENFLEEKFMLGLYFVRRKLQ